nr:uncharacterized protein LOC111413234 isoform X2 [Onthophagus taurus]
MGVLYLGSYSGVLRLNQLMFNTITSIILVLLSYSASNTQKDLTSCAFIASSGAVILTLVFLMIKSFDLDKIVKIPWHRIEMGFCVVWILFLLNMTPQLICNDGYAYKVTGIIFLLSSIFYVAEILECIEENKQEES